MNIKDIYRAGKSLIGATRNYQSMLGGMTKYQATNRVALDMFKGVYKAAASLNKENWMGRKIAGYATYGLGIKPLIAAGAIGAVGLGAVSVASKIASPFEFSMFKEYPPGPVHKALGKASPGLGFNYAQERMMHLNPGFLGTMGVGLIGGAAYTAASYSRALPPYTRPERVQMGEHPYNLGASGDMVLSMNNMR